MVANRKNRKFFAVFLSLALVLTLSQCSFQKEEKIAKESSLHYEGNTYKTENILAKVLKNSEYKTTVEEIKKMIAPKATENGKGDIDPEKEQLASQVLEYTDTVLGANTYSITIFNLRGSDLHPPLDYEQKGAKAKDRDRTDREKATQYHLEIYVVLKDEYKRNKENTSSYKFSGGWVWDENTQDNIFRYNNNYQTQKFEAQKRAELQKLYDSITGAYPMRIKEPQSYGSVRNYDREIFEAHLTWRDFKQSEMSLDIFVPYGTNKSDIDKFISQKFDKLDVYKQFNITEVRFYHMAKGAKYKNVNHSQHYMAQPKVIDRCYNYLVNGGKLVYSDEIFIG